MNRSFNVDEARRRLLGESITDFRFVENHVAIIETPEGALQLGAYLDSDGRPEMRATMVVQVPETVQIDKAH